VRGPERDEGRKVAQDQNRTPLRCDRPRPSVRLGPRSAKDA
jgi:hypothetical protein